MAHLDDRAALKARIRLLEERVQGLRASRRVLMNLLAAQVREKRSRITQLENEKRRLQRQTSSYARALVERNIRIVRLQNAGGNPGDGRGRAADVRVSSDPAL